MKEYIDAYLELLNMGCELYWNALEDTWEKLENIMFRQPK